MKDIRSEIEERLADANKRLTDLTSQIKDINIEVETLKKMMDLESQRLGHGVSPLQYRVSSSTKAPTAVVGSAPDFIEEFLQTGPHSKDQLKEVGIQKGVFDPDTAGRSLHITLVNMLRGNRIRELADGLYGLPEDHSPQRSDPPGAT